MAEKSPIRRELHHFGFSEKEIDTYLALLRLGESKAAEIASEAGVSKRYVYDVMERFEERDFVYIDKYEKPTTIKPLEPTDVVDHLDNRLDSLKTNLEETYTERSTEQQSRFEVLKSDQTVDKRLSKLIRETDEELIISVSKNYISHIESDLRQLVRDGVFVILLIQDVADSTGLADVSGLGTVVRTWSNSGPLLVISDQQRGLYQPARDLIASSSSYPAIMYFDSYFTQLLYPAFFTYGWGLADEVHIEPPFELPHTYENFRHAVFDAMMYYRRGETIFAELRVRPTKTGAPFETRFGKIVDIKQGLIKPESGMIPTQQSLIVNSDGETFTVSGVGSFFEDHEAESVKLLCGDESSTR